MQHADFDLVSVTWIEPPKTQPQQFFVTLVAYDKAVTIQSLFVIGLLKCNVSLSSFSKLQYVFSKDNPAKEL